MATVRKRGEKWYAIFKDHTGKWREQKGYADKKETERLAKRLEDEQYAIEIGDTDPQADARRIERAKPAEDHLAMFEAAMKSKGRNPRHIFCVMDNIRKCLTFTKAATAASLTRPMLEAWQNNCLAIGYPDHRHKDGKPLPDSRKTINHRLSSVRAWLRYLANVGAIDRCVMEGWDMLATRGHETKHRRALSKSEADALIEKCPDANRRELYRFAILTGFRRSECASMTPAAFDFTRKTIILNAKDAKRKTDHQIIPMHSDLVAPLKTMAATKQANQPIFHFPSHHDKTGIAPFVREDCIVAGVDPKGIDFHALRHTFCTLLAESGIRPEIMMKLARHKDLATTMRYYVHFKADDERAALERI